MQICIIFALLLSSSVCGQPPVLQQSGAAELDTLKYVYAIWRHGARTPAQPSPMANEADWKLGLGELTTKGQGQLFRLGQWMRRRYEGFLPVQYSPSALFVRSTDFNRTLCSAQALLAGLFPPTEREQFAPGLNWRPIPVHTGTPNESAKRCPNSTGQAPPDASTPFSRAETLQLARQNERLLRFLALKTTNSSQSPLPLEQLVNIYDPIYCMKQFKNGEHRLPEWLNETLLEHIWALYDRVAWLDYSTREQIRQKAATEFADILGQLKWASQQIGRGETRQKLYGYSAHDVTIASVLSAFGIRPPTFPHFAVLLLIELHREPNADGPTIVRIFYKNATDVDALWEWPIGECEAPCSLQTLEMAKRWLLPEEGEPQKCVYGEQFEHEEQNFYIVAFWVLSLLTTMLFLSTLVLWRKHRSGIVPVKKSVYPAEEEEEPSKKRRIGIFAFGMHTSPPVAVRPYHMEPDTRLRARSFLSTEKY